MNKAINKCIQNNKKSIAKQKTIYGVGINDADYYTQFTVEGKKMKCPYYSVWKRMLERCYSAKSQKNKPTYIGCSVDEKWLTFSNFSQWMKTQDWKNKHLDKDILIKGNKVYSSAGCLFVTKAINSLLITSKASRGDSPIGVNYHKLAGKYEAKLSINGKKKYLGLFDSKEAAHEAYKIAKYENIKQVAIQQTEPLRSALLNYIIEEY